uniref:Homeobox domain-containing protein n=1 Tax=Ditylenchus dipsaci TaxID=166011 RepID=A0A915EL53_9BILA
MLTCANWKSKEEKCCKCMVKEDQSHQLEAALTAASAYSDRIKELEDELALVKEQAKKKKYSRRKQNNPLQQSRLLKRRKERRTDSLDSTLSELDSPPTMVVRHSAIDSTADQLMTSKEAPILSPQASTPISTSRSQSQDSTTSIRPGRDTGLANTKEFKEHRDECCKLTKLNENQVNNWFHHRRKHGPLLSPVDTTATTKKQSRSYTLVPYP